MQTKRGSLFETLCNVGTGMLTSQLLNMYFLPVIGVHTTNAQNLLMLVVYTVVSIIRGFGWRRFWNWVTVRYGV